MYLRPRRRRVLAAVSGLMLGALLSPAATASASPAAPEAPEPARIDLVLDLSGSMNENDAGGQTRLAAAKQAVTRIIDTAPERAPLGLRVYGATYPGQDKKQGCADTQQVLPVTPMDGAARADAKKLVAGFKAVGFTPIGVSLREAAKDLGTSGKRRIVLVSDGEDTCAPPPPCEVARELKAQGIDLAVDVVGFRTPSSARAQLKCIADVTDGSYADADDADSLTANLGTLFRKGWRTYHATGKPVEGSLNGCQDAPLVTPGQYLDKFTGGRDLYYKVKKRPDQRLQVSATAVAEEGYSRGSIITVAAGPAGNGEPRDWLREFEQSMGWGNIISTGGRSKPGAGNETPAPDDTGCIMVGNQVTRSGDKPMPVELLVGIADKTAQEAGARTPEPRRGADAEGGFSFNSATPIGPGTHRQSIAVGEAPFWRVELKAGQKLTVKAGVDIPADFPNSATTGWSVTVYNAQRESTLCNEDHNMTKLFAGRTGNFERVCGPWQITERDDAKSPDSNGYDVPGTYYIQAQVAEPDDKAKGIVVPISLTVDVSGTPPSGNSPVFFFGDDAAQGPSPSGANGNDEQGRTGGTTAAAKDEESAVGKLALPVGVGAGLLLLGGITFYALRRRGAA
ncbi:VWA domain-containing protein [Streptomyces sp. KS 21]|uniref:vWA domain-containing protein n=1 Tax=Streptomyces sp. KS 21 TaxID=2485150 RepID=UPI0010DD7010|nr:VWA domain-containing protein [Streptomyces sp. KS 21]TDU73614.1 Ca-activated chloride channel family protein [Streptomyces sp. KS 21]